MTDYRESGAGAFGSMLCRMVCSALATLLLGACSTVAANNGAATDAAAPVVAQSGLPQAGLPQSQAPQVVTYRLRGDRSVRPLRVSDDGARTTIAFAPEQALPAVFALGPTGGEIAVNGYMRTGEYVIDRVHETLVFRIDRDRATAERQVARRGTR